MDTKVASMYAMNIGVRVSFQMGFLGIYAQ